MTLCGGPLPYKDGCMEVPAAPVSVELDPEKVEKYSLTPKKKAKLHAFW
jgi:L-alanine-DL-glutamate epimerase-like enolase superfamily enzyme